MTFGTSRDELWSQVNSVTDECRDNGLIDRLWDALESANNQLSAIKSITPFRFADYDDPERTLGDNVLWQSEVMSILEAVQR